MAARFDADNRTVELSVADLLEASLRRSLGFANRGGYERMWVGQAIHSRYQDRALEEQPGYRREVVVEHTFVHRGWEITLKGRADGLRREADGTLVVEEIKSVRRGSRLAAPVREVYERQALLYAWMLAREGESQVAAELVLIEIGSGELEREPLETDFEALEQTVRRRLNSLIASFESERDARERRYRTAAKLEFPYPSVRPGQGEILQAAETALEQGEHLLLEAPTGIGKTVAAILPAVRHALEHDRRVYVLTAKNLQQEMATQVLGLLNSEQSFHSLRLRAKARMCANDQVICHEEYCRFARDYYLKLQSSGVVAELMRASGTLLPDHIFAAAQHAEVCPFEVSLELTGQAQVVVADYNYAFEPYISLRHFAPTSDLSDAVLVIDEIHNLVGRARGYYSPVLSATAIRAAAEAVARGGRPLHRGIAHLCEELATLVEAVVADSLEDGGEGSRAVETLLPADDLAAFRVDFDGAFIDYLEWRREAKEFREEDPFVTLYFELLRFLDVLALSSGEAFSQCAEREGPEARLRILCKDPSRFLARVLHRVHAVIGLSATLSPPEFYRDLLGLDPERTVTVSVPSPFPEENRRVVIDSSVATTYRERPENTPRIAAQLSAFAEAVPGNCLALFPSYRFLADVADQMRLDGKRMLVQSRADSEAERQDILETLRSAMFGDVLLMAVAGGVFAEGVDYPGEMLKAVAVVGPCLPAVSLELQLLRDYYEERFARGFEYAAAVPGMTRVVQAAGRLIRSPEDTGVIALLDRRFLMPPYRDLMPRDWRVGEDGDAVEGDPAAAARDFFGAPSRLAPQ